MFFQGISEEVGALYISQPQATSTNVTTGPFSQSQSNSEQSRAPSIPWPQRSKQLEATGSLNFATHTFPLFATIKQGTLEGAFTVEEIQTFGEVPEHDVPRYLREVIERKAPNSAVQLKAPMTARYQVGGQEEKRYLYECIVDYTGHLTFQVSLQRHPYQLLQKAYGPDKVLRVTFGDDPNPKHDTYLRLLERGIFVGLRRYQFWVHKETDKKGSKYKDKESSASVRCYFVCTASRAAVDLVDPSFKASNSVADCRRHIMDIQTTKSIAAYQSRLLLALSRTMKLDLEFELKVEPDLRCKDAAGRELDVICTDGTGFISSDIASRIPANVTRGVQQSVGSFGNEWFAMTIGKGNFNLAGVCPALLQVRIFRDGYAIKGTLGVDHRLPPQTIVCRESMVKVRPDERPPAFPQVNSLELCNTSKNPHAGKLSSDLILISTVLDVPASFFLNIVQRAIDGMERKANDAASAFADIHWMTSDDAELARRMMGAGIPLKEPFLHQSLTRLRSSGWQDLKKGRVELPDSYNLIGTADSTGTLQRNQVAITLSQGPLNPISCPRVAVYRAPGKHPGDVHIFEPVWNIQLQSAVGNSKYAIYFSTRGTRAIYEEIGNGDLDGDRYWICTNPEFLSHLRPWQDPYVPRPVSSSVDKVRPADLPPEELERELRNAFLIARFQSRPFVGQAANYWTVHMDRLVMLDSNHEQERNMHWNMALEAAHVFYEAVNSAKSGFQVDSNILRKLRPQQMPHYLEKFSTKKVEGYGNQVHLEQPNVYHSTSILGQIFDMATQAEAAWLAAPPEIEVDPKFMFPNFDKHNKKWEDHFNVYRMEMAKTLVGQVPPGWSHKPSEDEIYLKYRKILFGSVSSSQEWIRVLEESSAIYATVYYKAQCGLSNGQVPRLSFAWRVAGYPLCEIYYRKQLPQMGSGVPMPFLECQPQVPFLFSYSAYNEIILHRQLH